MALDVVCWSYWFDDVRGCHIRWQLKIHKSSAHKREVKQEQDGGFVCSSHVSEVQSLLCLRNRIGGALAGAKIKGRELKPWDPHVDTAYWRTLESSLGDVNAGAMLSVFALCLR